MADVESTAGAAEIGPDWRRPTLTRSRLQARQSVATCSPAALTSDRQVAGAASSHSKQLAFSGK